MNPLGPVAGAFALDNSEVAVIMGPVGSAKTTAACLRLARHAWEQRPFNGIARSRWAIVRNTGPQLHDTTMKSWFKLFPTDNKWRKYVSTTKTQKWRFPIAKGCVLDAEFLFRALDDEDDVANLLSLEVTGFLFNEFREISTDIFANARARYGRYPGADLGGCTWRGAIGDTNPWAATSDFHEMFVVNKRPGFAFFKQPGGLDPDAENLENLEQTPETLALPWDDPRRREQGRTYYLRLLDTYKKHEADMYVASKYGASRSGKPVYESYDDNTHCRVFELGKTVIKGRECVPIKIGYDNTGRTPAAAILQRTANGQWRQRYECIAEGMGLQAHVKELKRFLADKIPTYEIEQITCDPAGQAKDSGELDMRMVVQNEFPGVRVVNARTNDVETRIAALDGPLRRLVNGEPAYIVHPDCKFTRAALLNKYQYRRIKLAGEERYTEVPDKSAKPYDDIMNGVQYAMLGGGEGRVDSDGTGSGPKWPKNGAAITPKAPEQQRRNQGPVFDPRMGTFFHDR